ncbi:DUF4254 domain-containing protein [uncultured Legionella sp.]|uniref:DUF4254 domain-containing protein n=1 Tax=uncultured Legionella sp. TaxID=210934 RepID=UPI00261C4D26|nr:DUF4254 domain-containing protein [uncultured Legionella sp.]
MSHNINPSVITDIHKNCIILWKASGIEYRHEQFFQLVEENHAFNYQLWHAEDRARRDDMGFEFVYQAKREIDSCNQQRNNRMEAMDEWLFRLLQPANPSLCPVNSESPGMIIDRLSILSLKSYHMTLQTERTDVSEEHNKNCAQKLAVIHQQLDQLKLCLGQLLDEVGEKTRTFRVYHQFKMYNDPTLNPELYCSE